MSFSIVIGRWSRGKQLNTCLWTGCFCFTLKNVKEDEVFSWFASRCRTEKGHSPLTLSENANLILLVFFLIDFDEGRSIYSRNPRYGLDSLWLLPHSLPESRPQIIKNIYKEFLFYIYRFQHMGCLCKIFSLRKEAFGKHINIMITPACGKISTGNFLL